MSEFDQKIGTEEGESRPIEVDALDVYPNQIFKNLYGSLDLAGKMIVDAGSVDGGNRMLESIIKQNGGFYMPMKAVDVDRQAYIGVGINAPGIPADSVENAAWDIYVSRFVLEHQPRVKRNFLIEQAVEKSVERADFFLHDWGTLSSSTHFELIEKSYAATFLFARDMGIDLWPVGQVERNISRAAIKYEKRVEVERYHRSEGDYGAELLSIMLKSATAAEKKLDDPALANVFRDIAYSITQMNEEGNPVNFIPPDVVRISAIISASKS